MNILKDEALVDKGFYPRAFREFGFEDAWSLVQGGATSYRFFALGRLEGRLLVSPVESLQLMHAVDRLGALLPLAARPQLMELLKQRRFGVLRKKDILCHLHLDLLLALLALKQDLPKGSPAYEGLREYLRTEAPGDDLEARLFRVSGPSHARSNIHTFNKNSVLLDLLDPAGCRNLDELAPEHVSLIRSCGILRYLEISEGFEPDRLQAFLKELDRASRLIVQRFPQATSHRLGLKLRKIRRTKKEGLYIVATNSALVDPRHTNQLWHELGHWAHTWAYPEMKARPECEAYAEAFQDLVEGSTSAALNAG